ncbi:MAG: GFA family protein [Paracoccaceae bacterium]
MSRGAGGCLCGRVRFELSQAPIRVTVCHCRFCQKATGSAYMVEPIFERDALSVLTGAPSVYDHVSAGSGKLVHVHFCRDCGTKLWLTFERFPDAVGVYAGTFDDPCWFPIQPETSKHIFLGAARRDTVIPPGLPTFREHATANDGMPLEPTIFASPHLIG